MKITNKTIGERETAFIKLPLGKLAELLDIVKDLPKRLASIEGLTNDDLMARLPEVILACLPEVEGVVLLCTDIEATEFEELGISDLVEILITIYEVNDLEKLFQRGKKAIARQ